MYTLYFSLTSLVLVSSVYAAEAQNNFPDEQSNASMSSQVSNKLTRDLRQDVLPTHLHETTDIEADKKSLQQEVVRYTNIVQRLELANGKISETIQSHYREYLEALEKLMKDSERNPQISIKEGLFFITQKHNIFSGGY